MVINDFIHWATFIRKIAPSTIVQYLSHLRLIHELRGIDASACKNFLCKTQIRGAQNLQFYQKTEKFNKKVMTLPVLKILGHGIAKTAWSARSKSVVWTTCCIGFFGSFRFGELLSRNEHKFNPFETLLWKDVRFIEDDSVMIHNKIPKTRTACGEYVSLFEFEGHNCCPIKALKCLKNLSEPTNPNFPVFMFSNGSFLTMKVMNEYIVRLLKSHLGNDAECYSCKSFRAALPSALAAFPSLNNDVSIKRWGRWKSSAFEKYTRLNHMAKKEIFAKFTDALNNV